MSDLEEFMMFSNACLNTIVDHIGTIDNKNDMRKFNDMYQHMLKLQRRCVETNDSESMEQFKREWGMREPAINGSAELDDDEALEQPSEAQLMEFKKTVQAWFQLDDEEKELRRKAGERSMLKKRLTTTILSFMQRFDIEDLKTREGNLRFFKREIRKAPNKNLQLQRIKDYFADKPEQADEFTTIVFKTEKEEKCGIRRLKLKQ